MRKFFYLCGMTLLCMDMMAQIDLNDENWECFINEDFSGVRSWSSLWEDQSNEPDHEPRWRCFSYCNWASGVTIVNHITGDYNGFQSYQPSHAIFGSDNTMKLRSEFISENKLYCGSGYDHAPWYKYCHYCESSIIDQHPEVHYYSGMIETIDSVGFGYYEIECKMPIHEHGECSSFWFWSCLGDTYNEIDVFEHTKRLCENDLERSILSGIWYNPLGTNYHNPGVGNEAIHYARNLYTLPENTSTLDEYHTFGCMWMPDSVVWYVDGEMINKCNDPDQIPQFPMWLKINHNVDENANSGTSDVPIWWSGIDEMTINYVKAYKLKTDCYTDVNIRNIHDFNRFDYKVKHSITMGGISTPLIIPDSSIFTMRAVESITIDGLFELPQGAKMTLITQSCPQCSMESVFMPEYDCGMDN